MNIQTGQEENQIETDAEFATGLAHLQAYAAREGHSQVPPNHIEERITATEHTPGTRDMTDKLRQAARMEYRVHVFTQYRVPVVVKAESMEAAITLAEAKAPNIVRLGNGPADEMERTGDAEEGYIVDVIGDEDYELSQWFPEKATQANARLIAAAPALEDALAGLVEAIEKLSTPELKAIPEPLRSALAYGYVHGRNALKAAAPEPTPRATATRLAATEPGA